MKPTARVSMTTAKPTTIRSSTTTTAPLPVAARRPDVSKSNFDILWLILNAPSTEKVVEFHIDS